MSSTTVFVPGTVYWAKIVGRKSLVDNYERTGKEWAYELVPDDVSFLKEHRLMDRLKDKEDPKNPDKGDFLVLKKPELDKDGNENKPITIYDADGAEWGEDRLLGNGTRVVAKLAIRDWGVGKKKSIFTQALRVEELVPYVSDAFGAYDGGKKAKAPPSDFEDDAPEKPASKTRAKQPVADLDDDLPF